MCGHTRYFKLEQSDKMGQKNIFGSNECSLTST